MGFSDLPPVEKIDTYLDTAFKKAKATARKHTLAERDKSALAREKTLSLLKLNAMKEYLVTKFDNLIASYPNMDNVSEFYKHLLKATLDYAKLKKGLGSLHWASQQLKRLSRTSRAKLLGATTVKAVKDHLTSYYGRASSVLKQINKDVEYVRQARRIMKTYPSVKEGVFTICIAGFPNVGKSTLLSKLTNAQPKINAYAFTTTTLNLGYATRRGVTFQFIDTPGTLNRLEKMNFVERQAFLALRYAADMVIYVFDVTEQSGYALDKQKKLLKQLKTHDKPIICYLSRTDILGEAAIEDFKHFFEKKTIPLFTDPDDIVEEVLILYRDSQGIRR